MAFNRRRESEMLNLFAWLLGISIRNIRWSAIKRQTGIKKIGKSKTQLLPSQ